MSGLDYGAVIVFALYTPVLYIESVKEWVRFGSGISG
jgi:hypothetical protein